MQQRTEPTLRRGMGTGSMGMEYSQQDSSSALPSTSILSMQQQQQQDERSDNPDRIVEESPNRRYAKVYLTFVRASGIYINGFFLRWSFFNHVL